MTSATVDWKVLKNLIADAYRAAALAEAPMPVIVDALEYVQKAARADPDVYKIWDAVNAQIGASEDSAARSVLCDLRTRFVDAVATAYEARIAHTDTAQDAAAAWAQAYAEALTHWRMTTLARIAEVAPATGISGRTRDEIVTVTQRIRHDRWAEAFTWLVALAKNEAVAPRERARITVTAAEAELYHFYDFDQAASLLRQAEALDPEEPSIEIGWAEHLLEAPDDLDENDKLEQARNRLQAVLSRRPDFSRAYTVMADTYERAGDLAAAEQWCREAVRAHTGRSDGYLALLRLLGRKDPTVAGAEVDAVLEATIAVEPDDEYQAYVWLGDACRARPDPDAARSWYDRAVALDETRWWALARIAGELAEAGHFDAAQAAYERVTAVAPEAFDGYWGLAWVAELRGDWPTMISCLREGLQRRPEWERLIRSKIATAEAELGNTEAAIEELATAAQAPHASDAFSVADQLLNQWTAAEHYDDAKALLDRLRETLGSDYELDYRSRLSRLAFSRGDYAEAEAAYRQALELQPSDGALYAELAGALRELRRWDDALAAIEQAEALGAGDCTADRALLSNSHGNELFEMGSFEEAAEQYRHATTLSPDDAVIWSNLALALASIRDPVVRRRRLPEALRAADSAARLDPESEEKHEQLDALRIEQHLNEQFPDGGPGDPIVVVLSTDLLPSLLVTGTTELNEVTVASLERLRARVRDRLGLAVPWIRFREAEQEGPGTYLLLLAEQLAVRGTVPAGRCYSPAPIEELRAHARDVVEAADLESGVRGGWVPADQMPLLRQQGLEVWDVIDYPLRHLELLLEDALAPLHQRTEIEALPIA